MTSEHPMHFKRAVSMITSQTSAKELRARIVGISSYLPEQVLSNSDLEQMVDTSDDWIVTRTGIKERRIADSEECTSDMGAKAAERVLEKCRVDVSEIDLIIVATLTPDYKTPSTAGIIQSKLKATKAAAFDLQAACSGFIYGLATAKAYVESRLARRVLFIASEKMSSVVDYTDRNTCILFGDGASAAIITAEGPGLMVDHIELGSDGDLANLILIPAGGAKIPYSEKVCLERQQYVKMAGKEVFKHAIRRMGSVIHNCLQSAQIDESQVRWLIPHQANVRILDAVAEGFSVPVYKILHKYGNTSASSIGIALSELLDEETLSHDDRMLLVAFGAGLTWGGVLLRHHAPEKV